jgi:glycosyltransferase involved in cell wall biosynthesis
MSGTVHEIRYLRNAYPGAEKKTVYIPNGVLPRPDVYWNNQKELPPAFFSVGTLTWKKNLQHTLKVFSIIKEHIPEARLYCVGTGVSDSVLFGACGAGGKGIENISSAAFGDMGGWYTTCPYIISASRFEGGHPLALLEAMSFGVMVFAAAIPAHREMITHDLNGYLIGGSNARQDAAGILDTLEKGSGRDIRVNAWQTACRNRWSRQVTRLEKLLCGKQ